MIRLIVEFLLPLLAPTLLYSFWLAWERRRLDAGGADATGKVPTMREAPWVWLGGIGIVFVLLVAIVLGMTRSLGDIGGTYVPPRSVDGRVVPGHLDPPPR